MASLEYCSSETVLARSKAKVDRAERMNSSATDSLTPPAASASEIRSRVLRVRRQSYGPARERDSAPSGKYVPRSQCTPSELPSGLVGDQIQSEKGCEDAEGVLQEGQISRPERSSMYRKSSRAQVVVACAHDERSASAQEFRVIAEVGSPTACIPSSLNSRAKFLSSDSLPTRIAPCRSCPNLDTSKGESRPSRG